MKKSIFCHEEVLKEVLVETLTKRLVQYSNSMSFLTYVVVVNQTVVNGVLKLKEIPSGFHANYIVSHYVVILHMCT